ncbi:hypothetical protein CTAYLR_002324, partial [Chrysophaeum taylorii]
MAMIAALCARIVEDPEAAVRRPAAVEGEARGVSLVGQLLALAGDASSETRGLAMASATAVFVDVLPSYRIRPPTAAERETQQSKEVYRLRQHESGLLAAYAALVKLLSGVATKKKSSVGAVAVRCLGRLLAEKPRFNFADEVVRLVVSKVEASDGAERAEAVAAVKELLRRDRSGEASLAVIRGIGKIVRACGGRLRTEGPLLALETLEVKACESEARAEKIAAKALKDAAAKQHKKKRKRPDAVTSAEVRAAASSMLEADVVVSERANREIVAEVAGIYLRVLRTEHRAATTTLAARGLKRVAHAVNADVLGEALKLLEKAAGSPAVDARSRLECALAAVQVVATPGYRDALGDVVDDSTLSMAVYESLLAAAVGGMLDDSAVRAAFACVDACLLRRKHSAVAKRAAAFARRSLAISAHADHALILVSIARLVFAKFPALEDLVTDDEPPPVGVGGATAATFDPFAPDPDAAAALAVPAWELLALARHYDPDVRRRASALLRFDIKSSLDNPLALLERKRQWRPKFYTRMTPMSKLASKFAVLCALWLIGDSAIFYLLSRAFCRGQNKSPKAAASSGECWSFAYAFWFCVETGFGVGWSEGFEQRGLQLFSVYHCLVGDFVVLASLELFVIYNSRKIFSSELSRREKQLAAVDRTLRRTSRRVDSVDPPIFGSHEMGLLVLWLVYATIGAVYGVVHERLSVFSAALYSTSALTTAGLVKPKASKLTRPPMPLVINGFYLLFGIPLTSALGSTVWAKYFTKYEHRMRRRAYYEALIKRRRSATELTATRHTEPSFTHRIDNAPRRRSHSEEPPVRDHNNKLLVAPRPTISESDAVDWALYLENELLDLGLIDARLLAEIRVGYHAWRATKDNNNTNDDDVDDDDDDAKTEISSVSSNKRRPRTAPAV